MTSKYQVSYGEVTGHFRAVKLPYKGGLIAIAVLPALAMYKDNLGLAMDGITPQWLFNSLNWHNLIDVASLEVVLPRFSMRVRTLPLAEVRGSPCSCLAQACVIMLTQTE